jgi:hypothetical protein
MWEDGKTISMPSYGTTAYGGSEYNNGALWMIKP